MAFPGALDAHSIPIHRLFPEHYEASKRMIVRDFIFLGSTLVLSIVLAALVNVAIN